MRGKGDLGGAAIFGGADGMTSLLGVVVLLSRTSPSTALVAALAGAATSGVSMAGGEWLDGGSVRRGAVMGLATLVGVVLPALPLLVVRGSAAVVSALAVVAVAGIALTAMRRERYGWAGAAARVYGVLALASGLALAASALAPGGA